jgi:predicted SAM-dependent methyltransferase|tara:strand:- start:602 stop:1144 length:543 start_codon:yes stop_codon:yes gene_type:complete
MTKINMGCGWRNFGPDWIHIDSGDYEHLDYSSIMDLSQFKNNSVDLIYASHVIEYFDKNTVVELLSEWHRVLKIGGLLRIAVPNFKVIASLYTSGDYSLESFIGPLYGRMSMGDSTIYHKHVYDFKTLKKLLSTCQFKDYRLYDWRDTEHSNFDDHSQAYLPHMDKENGTLISLNVECNK